MARWSTPRRDIIGIADGEHLLRSSVAEGENTRKGRGGRSDESTNSESHGNRTNMQSMVRNTSELLPTRQGKGITHNKLAASSKLMHQKQHFLFQVHGPVRADSSSSWHHLGRHLNKSVTITITATINKHCGYSSHHCDCTCFGLTATTAINKNPTAPKTEATSKPQEL